MLGSCVDSSSTSRSTETPTSSRTTSGRVSDESSRSRWSPSRGPRRRVWRLLTYWSSGARPTCTACRARAPGRPAEMRHTSRARRSTSIRTPKVKDSAIGSRVAGDRAVCRCCLRHVDRRPRLLTGRASKGIAKRLAELGDRLAAEPESFVVDSENHLLAGEADRAEAWASTLTGARPGGPAADRSRRSSAGRRSWSRGARTVGRRTRRLRSGGSCRAWPAGWTRSS